MDLDVPDAQKIIDLEAMISMTSHFPFYNFFREE
jgi:hypothetical protein